MNDIDAFNSNSERVVKTLLMHIEDYKKELNPFSRDRNTMIRKEMKKLYRELEKAKGDNYFPETNQLNRFQTHTSMRAWRDDA